MTITRDQQEILTLTGVPASHQGAFQAVANQQRCIIMSRAVGIACTQLIEEGYSSKGFHVKAKSCNWGPMSGFVLEDPNLTKRMPDEAAKQESDLVHAFRDWNAKATPLYISEPRRTALEQAGTIVQAPGSTGRRKVVWGKQFNNSSSTYDGTKAVRMMKFRLEHTPGSTLTNAPHADMWAVRYDDAGDATHAGRIRDGGAVYAMVNPAGLGGKAGGVRSAITGDYDLFSLCVHRDRYRPGGRDTRGFDARMVSVNQLEKNIKTDKPDLGEDRHLGNMSQRHHAIRNALNEAFRQVGYVGGNMVHHSDEAGRPFIDDVDMPVFAVVPGQGTPYGIENLADLREFWFTWTREGPYVPFFNPHWMSWLTLGKKGADIHKAIRKGVQLTPVT